MKRPTTIVTTAVTAAILFALTPGVAHADTVTAPSVPAGPESISVNTAAQIVSNGKAVQWNVGFTCSKGETYRVHLWIRQIRAGADLPKPYRGGQNADIDATRDLTGNCKGKPQKINAKLTVEPTAVTSSAGTQGILLLPVRRTNAADVAMAYLSTSAKVDNHGPQYCSVVITPAEDGTICEEYTLLGPNLKLR
ncbi:MAG: hypothetical protein JWQ43_2394 [Glaciihabitans sp.]|nr:hypothetical protein [Glaciihabitans sp.]